MLGTLSDQSTLIILAKFIPKIASESSTLYGLAATFFYLGNIILTYPMVKWSKKIGRKRMLIIAFLFRALGTLLLYFAPNIWIVYLARLITGFCATGAVLGALIHDHFLPDKRGLPLGVNSVALLVGYLIGAILGGLLYTTFGDRISFLIADAFIIIGLLDIIINIKDKPAILSEEDKPKNISLLNIFKTQLLNNKALVGCYLMAFINNIAFAGLGSYAIYMLFTYYEIPELIGGLYMIIPITLQVIVFIGVGGKVKKYTKFYKRIFFITLLPICSAFFLFIYSPLWYYWTIGSVLVMLVAGTMQSTDTIAISLVSADNKSELLGIYRIIALLGNIIGPALFGLMVDFIWPFFPGFFSLFMVLLTVLIYWKMVKETQN